MSWLETLYTLSQASLLLLLAAAVVLLGWIYRPKHFYLLWLCVGLLILACAEHLQTPAMPWYVQFGVVFLYWAGICGVAQSVAMRWGRSVNLNVIVGSALCLMLGFGMFKQIELNVHLYQLLIPWIFALVLGHVFIIVRHCAKRHQVEGVLLWVYSIFVASFIASPSLQGSYWDVFNTSSALLSLLAAALSGVMLACAFQDNSFGCAAERDSDALTGLLNRNGFEKSCGTRLSDQAITVIVFCELDRFAHFEQQYGAATSRSVLRGFARLLQACTREGDLVARVGEQEFALALRNMDVADAQALVERFNAGMRQQNWSNDRPLTASFSVAQVRDDDSLSRALHRADVLLCQAEDDGNNRTVIDGQTNSAIAIFSYP